MATPLRARLPASRRTARTRTGRRFRRLERYLKAQLMWHRVYRLTSYLKSASGSYRCSL